MQRCSVPVAQGITVIPKFYFNSYTRQTRRTAAPVDEIHVTLPEIDLEYQSSGQNDQSASGENHKENQSAVHTEKENTGDLHAEKLVEELQGSAKKVNNPQTSCTSRARRESLAHSGKRRVSNRSKLKKTDIGLADVLSAIDRGARDHRRESQENEHKDRNYQESINDIVDSLTQKGVHSWDVVDKRTNSRGRKKTRGHIKLKTHRPKGGGRRKNMASRRNNLGLETVVARSPSVCRSYSKEDILVPIEMSSRFISTFAQDANRVFGNNGWLMRRSKSLDRIGPMPVASSSGSSSQKSGKGDRNGFLPIMSLRPSVVSQRPLGSTRSYSISAKRGTKQNADSDYADQLSKSRPLSHSKYTKTPVIVTLDANVLKENDSKRSSVESGVYRRLKSADLSRDGHVDARNLTAMKYTLLQRESTINGTITNGANVKQCDRVATKEGKENMQVRYPEGGSPTNSNTTSNSDNQSRTPPDMTSDKKKDTKQKMTNGHIGRHGSRELPKSILKIKQESVPCVDSSDSSSRTTTESSASASSATRKTRKKRLVAERIARANLGLSEFTGVEIEPEMGSGVVASHYPGDTDVEFVLERKPTRVRFNSDDEVMEYVPW